MLYLNRLDFVPQMGIEREIIAQTLRLLDLPEDIQAQIITRVINFSHGRVLV